MTTNSRSIFNSDFLTDGDVDRILRDIHRQDTAPGERKICGECGWIWPCATVQALDHVKARQLGATNSQ